jgi:NADH-quinone oxidoreductase subunit I
MAIVVKARKMTLSERLYFPSIIKGMLLTLSHMFKKKVTMQYPEVQKILPVGYRGAHRLNKDDQDRVKCVACEMCAVACPAHCITIEGMESGWEDREKIPRTFQIDMLRCIFCGMCVEACPEDAIDMTNNIDLVAITREAMIWDKDRLLANFDDSKDQKGTLGQSLRGGQVSFTRPRGQALLPDKDGH